MKLNEVDADLSAALKISPLPPTPSNLQQRVRGRIRTQRMQTQLNVGLRAAAVLLVSVLVFQAWRQSSNLVKPTSEPSATALSAAELDFLFAPPPVDPLLVVDQQQQIAFRTFQHWESNR